MELDEELLARIRAAASFDKTVKVSDFQLRAGENGSVLINLRTGLAQLVYDDDSELHDLEDLKVYDLKSCNCGR
jgi:hypothetical protein